MRSKYLFKTLAVLACLLCSLSAAAAEAYACYTSDNTTLTFYYDNQRSNRSGTTYDLNPDTARPGWYTDRTCNSVTKVVFDPSFADARPISTYAWFSSMTSLQSIIGMKEYLNTANVTRMSDMFNNCNRLTAVDVSGFNTANVTDMNYMFYSCQLLASLDLRSFNTANVTDMYCMFAMCWALTSVDVSSFNTANVTDMGGMFSRCWALTNLDLSNFNTANVTNMYYMFSYCMMSSLDLSNFNTANVTNMQDMFRGATNLATIYVGDKWTTAAVTTSDNMFLTCTSLEGGQGTTYDANHVNADYAHIDGGPSNPGYLTGKVGFIRGDVNCDNNINIADVTALIDYLLTGDTAGINLNNADCNQDEGINIADVTSLIDYLLSGSW